MKLVVIYGPPAVGKLTVAKTLSELTGFKVLHNHLISDLILSVFSRGTPIASHLHHQIRRLIYETAAKNNLVGVISTFVYNHDHQQAVQESVSEFVKVVGESGGETFVIRLSCDWETLKQRVVSPSRVGTQKMSSAERLEQELARQNLISELSLPGTTARTFHIDNTKLSSDEVAHLIKDRCNL